MIYRRLSMLRQEEVEQVQEYVLGGRYEVFEKLGFWAAGSWRVSTVWLCLDTMAEVLRWCTVKVMKASRSSEICAEL
jgi:hypothetical protein